MPKVCGVFLETLEEVPQTHHRDCSFSSLLGRRGKRNSGKREDRTVLEEHEALKRWNQMVQPFPWSVDTPLADTGMRINVWHGFDPEARKAPKQRRLSDKITSLPIQNYNATIHIPKGWVMLWRGDVVHAGGLQNKGQNTALRVHWYVPMKLDDTPTIEANYLDKGDANPMASVDRSCRKERCLSNFLGFWEEEKYCD